MRCIPEQLAPDPLLRLRRCVHPRRLGGELLVLGSRTVLLDLLLPLRGVHGGRRGARSALLLRGPAHELQIEGKHGWREILHAQPVEVLLVHHQVAHALLRLLRPPHGGVAGGKVLNLPYLTLCMHSLQVYLVYETAIDQYYILPRGTKDWLGCLLAHFVDAASTPDSLLVEICGAFPSERNPYAIYIFQVVLHYLWTAVMFAITLTAEAREFWRRLFCGGTFVCPRKAAKVAPCVDVCDAKTTELARYLSTVLAPPSLSNSISLMYLSSTMCGERMAAREEDETIYNGLVGSDLTTADNHLVTSTSGFSRLTEDNPQPFALTGGEESPRDG